MIETIDSNCLRCKKIQPIEIIDVVKDKAGKMRRRGKCTVCDAGYSRYIKKIK